MNGLPPLPVPYFDLSFGAHDERWYTAEQMQEYGRAVLNHARQLQANTQPQTNPSVKTRANSTHISARKRS